jgi:hypothetical protein
MIAPVFLRIKIFDHARRTAAAGDGETVAAKKGQVVMISL